MQKDKELNLGPKKFFFYVYLDFNYEKPFS